MDNSISLPEPMKSLLSGLEPKTITNFYGGPGTGKTCVCLLLALECVKNNGNVIFIDTEGGFSLERIKQLIPFEKIENVLEKIQLIEPKNFKEQGKIIRTLENKKTDLIILDSLVSLYRLEYADAEQKRMQEVNVQIMEANRELSKQLSILSNIAREKNIPVIVTSHMFRKMETGECDIVGGDAVKYWSKIIVLFEKTGRTSERKVTITRHHFLSEGKSVKFMLVDDGIRPSGFRLF